MSDTFKKVAGILTALIVYSSVFAQDDSTDLNFYSDEPVLITSDDSMMYDNHSFKGLFLDFEIADEDNFANIQIEVFEPFSGSILYRREFTLNQLSDYNDSTGDEFHMFLGNVQVGWTYKVFLVIETNGGALGNVISKTLVL